jgi:hypothetical protein
LTIGRTAIAPAMRSILACIAPSPNMYPAITGGASRHVRKPKCVTTASGVSVTQ